MKYKQILEKCLAHHDLTTEEMEFMMQEIMTRHVTPAQIAAFLIALRAKGESVTEITAAVHVMRKWATPVICHNDHLIDIVGTGGDGMQTFNISTAVSFIVAAAGGKVAKHGNRQVSSTSGSADVLEAAGIHMNLTPEQVVHCVNLIGIGFMFAPQYHQALQHVTTIRKELKVRTLFNLLGPLTNPAHAPYHLIGVYDAHWLQPFAAVLNNLGAHHALIVHGQDGLDEISITTATQVAELKHGVITNYEIIPEQFGLTRHSLQSLQVNNAAESLQLILRVFNNEPIPAREIVIFNAAAALYAADITVSISAGVALARDILVSGKALDKFNEFKHLTQSMLEHTT